MTPNKQFQRTVIRRRGRAASAPFHYALAARFTRHRAAAELRRYAARESLPAQSFSIYANSYKKRHCGVLYSFVSREPCVLLHCSSSVRRWGSSWPAYMVQPSSVTRVDSQGSFFFQSALAPRLMRKLSEKGC